MVVNITEVITDENGLTYEINNNDFKARIINSPKAHDELLIPRSLIHESKENILEIEKNVHTAQTSNLLHFLRVQNYSQ